MPIFIPFSGIPANLDYIDLKPQDGSIRQMDYNRTFINLLNLNYFGLNHLPRCGAW